MAATLTLCASRKMLSSVWNHAVDLKAAFDTVNHNVLLSKIARSTLPEATCRWMLNYIRGRPSVTSCRGVKSKARIIHTGVSLFSFYIAEMPRPTEPLDDEHGHKNNNN